MPRIQVGIRLRPIVTSDEFMPGLSVDAPSGKVDLFANETQHKFKYDHVFVEDSSQEKVFNSSTMATIDSVMDGFNGCIFAFGQTGSGKTHTMSGPPVYHIDDVGIVPRSAEYIFKRIRELSNTARKGQQVSISVRMSAMEIYNEGLHDLLKEEPEATENPEWNVTTEALHDPKLQIVDGPQGIVVPALYVLPVSDTDEAYDLIFRALANRAVAEHNMNRRSSRSHLIVTFYITRTRQTGMEDKPTATTTSRRPRGGMGMSSATVVESASPEVLQSKLHLVDLAGSERTEKSGAEGNTMREASHINKSLSFLEQVVVALCQQRREHIPYRSSKLTHLLKDSLGGNSLTYLVACIWPHRHHVWESLSTLRFATRMMAIENHPMRNKLVSNEGKGNTQLLKQIESLRRELALRDAVSATLRPPLSHSHGDLDGSGVPGVPAFPRPGAEGADDGTKGSGLGPWLDRLGKKQMKDVVARAANLVMWEAAHRDGDEAGYSTGADLDLALCDSEGFRSLAEIRCVIGLMRAIAVEASGGDASVLSAAVSRVMSSALGDAHATVDLAAPAVAAAATASASRIDGGERTDHSPVACGGADAEPEPEPGESSTLGHEARLRPAVTGAPAASSSPVQEGSPLLVKGTPPHGHAPMSGRMTPAPSLTFEEFKHGDGAVLHADYQEVLRSLKNCKARLKTTVGLVNQQKALIDAKAKELTDADIAAETAEAQGVSDGAVALRLDAGLARRELDAAKKSYRDAYQELGLCKRQLAEYQGLKGRALDCLVTAFERLTRGAQDAG